ncbi:MAG: UDP-N-acetylglucosamine 2-epimerase (hydrolyzing), partial [Thermoplasmata archaeon]|nr:UDP-N-acetylglucosamine 2-epimerase (hydrolyzing) [Thermoplasmata archaeon]
LAASITAAYMNIPVAHIHGGDVSGSIDDLVRHAITKFAHIHFPATESSARRISQMGEEPHRILKVGALALDSILNMELPEPDELVDRYGVDLDRPIIIVLQHPVTSESDDAEQQIRITLDAIAGADYQTLIIYPNADSGGRRIIEVIREFENRDLINSFESVPHIDFLALMNISSALVGNSSAGIIEAPSFHLPVVNIGSRQSGRERAENIIDVGHDRTEITNAIVKALGDEFRSLAGNCINPYGDGMTSARIIKALTDITIDKSLMSKKYQLGGL